MASNITLSDKIETGDQVVLWRDRWNRFVGVPKDLFLKKNTLKWLFYTVTDTGYSVSIEEFANDTHLVVEGTSTVATGFITLPKNPIDGLTVTITPKLTTTLLTIYPNAGDEVEFSPKLATAQQAIVLRYCLQKFTWFVAG